DSFLPDESHTNVLYIGVTISFLPSLFRSTTEGDETHPVSPAGRLKANVGICTGPDDISGWQVAVGGTAPSSRGVASLGPASVPGEASPLVAEESSPPQEAAATSGAQAKRAGQCFMIGGYR